MARWKKPKPNKHDKDRQAGQGFLFETQTDHLSPWEKDDLAWRDSKESRRAELVEKKHRDSLTPNEQAELELLQKQFGQHQDAVAPFPNDEIPF